MLKFEFLFNLSAEVGELDFAGGGAVGRAPRRLHRRPARSKGRRCAANCIGGADWQILRSDGVLELDARYAIKEQGGGDHPGAEPGPSPRSAGGDGAARARRGRRTRRATSSAPSCGSRPARASLRGSTRRSRWRRRNARHAAWSCAPGGCCSGVRAAARRAPSDQSGSGMNSFSSPGTVSKRPSFQSAFACSIRSLRDETKFHQMWRGPSIAAPPTSAMRASTGALTADRIAGTQDQQLPGLEAVAGDVDLAGDDVDRALLGRRHRSAGPRPPSVARRRRWCRTVSAPATSAHRDCRRSGGWSCPPR